MASPPDELSSDGDAGIASEDDLITGEDLIEETSTWERQVLAANLEAVTVGPLVVQLDVDEMLSHKLTVDTWQYENEGEQ